MKKIKTYRLFEFTSNNTDETGRINTAYKKNTPWYAYTHYHHDYKFDSCEEIEHVEYFNLAEEAIEMTQNDVKSLDRLVNSISDFDGDYLNHSAKYIIKYKQKVRISVIKLEDDYFIISIDGLNFYKCDQLDGVLSFLKIILNGDK